MAKQLLYAEEARQKLKEGVDAVAKAVATTLGPKGRNVALDKKWGAPSVVHDGVSVAKEVELEDPFANMGAQLVKEAASKTNDVAGDGTTTATVLAQAIIDAGLKNVTAGANPMILKRGIEKAVATVVSELKKMAKPLKGKEEIAQVATISAADVTIGNLVAEALEKVGKDGVVTVEESKGLETNVEYKEGMEFDQGFVSPYFVTNPERMEAEIEDPYILITDKKISAISDLVPFLEKFVQVSKSLVIIADEVEGEALATLVVNKLRGTVNILAVKAPGFGDRRKAMLEDIATLTGGTVISEDLGKKLESTEVADLGRAKKVVSDKENTLIVALPETKSAVAGRISQIKREIEKTDSEFDREKLEERLAKLAGGVAVVNVGAATEVEMKEKVERVKDAVGATKAAMEEGIVPGGGVALIRIIPALDKLLKDSSLSDEEQVGVKIIKESLTEPLRQIAANAGARADAVVETILKSKDTDFGFDAADQQYKSLVPAGIIDPAKVTISALQNAASVGVMVLTTESLITEKETEQKTPTVPGGMPPEY